MLMGKIFYPKKWVEKRRWTSSEAAKWRTSSWSVFTTSYGACNAAVHYRKPPPSQTIRVEDGHNLICWVTLTDWPLLSFVHLCVCPVCALPPNDAVSAPLTSDQTGNCDLSPICLLVWPRVVQLAHLLSPLCVLVRECVSALCSCDASLQTQMDGESESEDGRMLIASQSGKGGENLVIFLNACCCNHSHI